MSNSVLVRMDFGPSKKPVVIANGVPMWSVIRLGSPVRLTKAWDEYGDGEVVHAEGKLGRLDGIQAHEDEGCRALVEFGDEGLVDIPFDHLAPDQ